ncbi:D-Ala-D-Ala carboxypeptidase family metallohydrolase [Thermoleptolyngbya sp. M55_K2018_002]|uniref:D-Ala-D-Ala carboxypeptidase family metallohydrolase n=1 Tax=Thermoleptolyngbya sp. M55_K2018_002 TaxID=2747808 RepID=UPI0019F4858A|nr:D-Ala-D-Ala carboxypeptidase family metallohydrolase [Thermoleptolyngbya sp. M55_K2018_002]HIK42163.1 DUF882 domain-containing protein [Thermoleptolyngbya sp. M55_K2018_002]
MTKTLTLQILQDTWLKQAPRQSSELHSSARLFIEKGKSLSITGYGSGPESAGDDVTVHVLVQLSTPLSSKRAWYAYQRHVAVMDGDALLFPAPEVDEGTGDRALSKTPNYTGKRLRLPSGATVYTDQPIVAGGSFSWGEATHGGTRSVQKAAHEQNIIRLAIALQKARNEIGKPFRVTSWYRPEPFNSNAGGAKFSQHLGGGAVDIAVEGFSGAQLANRLVQWWPGGLGIYPGNRRHILHLDIGGKRKWGF